MKHSNVYYIPCENGAIDSKMLDTLEIVLTFKSFRLLDQFKNNDLVGIKLPDTYQFGVTDLPPVLFVKLISILSKKSVNGFLCNTSSRFQDRSLNAVKELTAYYQSGFHTSHTKAPFMMLDGIDGGMDSVLAVESHTKHKIHLAAELNHLHGLVIVADGKSHPLCGYCGALFQLGSGTASKKGKIAQYSMTKPKINSEHCFYCRKCLHACPVKAIFVKDRHIQIDEQTCINCGKCVDIARLGGIIYEWNATPSHFQCEMLIYAKSVLRCLNHNMLFCNVLQNGRGILVSKDPVAIDQASLDLLKPKNDLINLDMSSMVVEAAGKMGIGNQNYQIESIAY